MANQVLVYQLHRARRRTIGFQVNEHGLTIRAPRSIAVRDIELAIVENHRWIFAKQTEWRARCERLRESAIRFADGGVVQYLGALMTLRLDATEAHANDVKSEIHLALSQAATEIEVREALQSWLQNQALFIFSERIERFADRMPARFAGWRLSSARTQWGSCSRVGRVRLNWRLMHFTLPVIDYVIAHELAHLRELNHSARFWGEVARLLPGFEAARDQIKRIEIAAISF
ncbi:MAG TPA: SprT family zinc-dependent metalloprotease [Burkholderiaceae bacterium]|nr:SprT family zinc-dependent metalloprotease [Burkholderiaceae bacterium]